MATGHRIPNDLYNSAMSASNIIVDPGSEITGTGPTIPVTISGGVCRMDRGTGDGCRTLQSPATVPVGVEVTLISSGGSGDSTIKYTGYDGGSTKAEIEMDNDGDWVRLICLNGPLETNYWRAVASDGVAFS